LSDNYSNAMVADTLDKIKNLSYRYASQSGLTVSIDDVRTPASKKAILEDHEAQADKVEQQFKRGIITDGERRQQEVRIWTDATNAVTRDMEAEFKAQRFNPIDMMVGSGARGNMTQMRQIAAMRGLVANPRGDMIPRPIKSNFREGLETLEYFIATPGARKGLVDTALRTADSGYLTRRLVDVAQELIVREDDCGTTLGIWVENVQADTANTRSYLETKLFGRALLSDVELSAPMPDGRTVLATQSSGTTRWLRCAMIRPSTVSGCALCSPATPNSAFAVSATAARSRPASESNSAKPSASLLPSRSASPAHS
jgi:DNA-directed RNA polymerase subunit beta'